jgi:hypothetical protein
MSKELATKTNDTELRSGFGMGMQTGDAIDKRQVGAATAIASAEAELKAQLFIALEHPRDEDESFRRIVRSCKRATFAESALYSFPRGGSKVEGPSVNLAREVARHWKNIRFGLRMVSADRDWFHIQGFAHDLESNHYVTMEDRFEKLIQRRNRDGSTRWVEPDERDARELCNRRGAICVRNAILQVIPSDIIEEAVRQVGETIRQAAAGEVEQDKASAVRRLVLAFNQVSVNRATLERHLAHDIDDISPDELADLRKVFVSIRDGNTKAAEHFQMEPRGDVAPVDQGGSVGDRLAAKLKQNAATNAPTTDGPTATTEATTPPDDAKKKKTRGKKKTETPAPHVLDDDMKDAEPFTNESVTPAASVMQADAPKITPDDIFVLGSSDKKKWKSGHPRWKSSVGVLSNLLRCTQGEAEEKMSAFVITEYKTAPVNLDDSHLSALAEVIAEGMIE